MKPEKKDFCINRKCGPFVTTGFQHEQYKVCKTCKLEVTDKLVERVESDQDDSPYGFDPLSDRLNGQNLSELYEKLVKDGIVL